MDKDRVKGTAKQVQGKAIEAKGDVTGSTKDKVKGAVKNAEGTVQKKVGQAKDAVRKSTK